MIRSEDDMRRSRRRQRFAAAVTSHRRRDRNRAVGACINETRAGTHGPATRGCRCERCYVVHSGSATRKAVSP